MFWMILASIAGTGTPPSLDCEIQQGDKPLLVHITADEAKQSATIAFEAGDIIVRLATFSADEIIIADAPFIWTIDRAKQTIQRENIFPPEKIEYGQCKLSTQSENHAS